MAQVDPEDEHLRRWIVQRYRYDSERRERRNVTEIAFDNQAEFEAYFNEAQARLLREKAGGLAESVEHYRGVIHEPGHREAMRRRSRGQAEG